MAIALAAALVLASCAGKKAKTGSEQPSTGEPPKTVFDDQNYFVVFVDEGGSIFLDDIPVKEEEMLDRARERFADNPDIKAILFVSSNQIQAIHLTALLSEVGYKNVTIYYPTATQNQPEP